MTELVVDGVTAGPRRGPVVLRDVSLDVTPGEMVAVWGMRRSGRTTLLRVAGGVLAPTAGRVMLGGVPVRERVREIGWAEPSLSSYQRGTVADHVAVPLLPRRVPLRAAVEQAHRMLARVGLPDVGHRDPRDLRPAELVRAGIARALISGPRLLLLDEPTNGVGALDADPIMETLRSVADEGVAVLLTVGHDEGDPVGARRLILGNGSLSGDVTPDPAPIVPLPRGVDAAP